MSTANLLNLDVDKIFEQHSINEVEAVNRKIQAEIENKREELRTMVRKLRDLINVLSDGDMSVWFVSRLVRDIVILFKQPIQSLK